MTAERKRERKKMKLTLKESDCFILTFLGMTIPLLTGRKNILIKYCTILYEIIHLVRLLFTVTLFYKTRTVCTTRGVRQNRLHIRQSKIKY